MKTFSTQQQPGAISAHKKLHIKDIIFEIKGGNF